MYVEYEKGTKHIKVGGAISDDINAFDDCGYVLSEQDLVVDIDGLSHEVIEAMLKEFSIKTQVVWTDRGAHLYFNKPIGFRGAQGVCALGFKCEYKKATKDHNSITIKRNGKARRIQNKDIREELPKFLKPLRGVKEPLTSLEEGDGRNNTLFSFKPKLKNIPNRDKCLRFINNHIFSEPLDEKELEVVLRDTDYDGEASEESVVAELIMRECKAVLYAEDIYLYNGTEWINEENETIRMIYAYCEGRPTRFVDEVVKQLRYRTTYVNAGTVFDIRLKNGILRKGKFIPVDTGEFSPFYIPVTYKPDAHNVEIVDTYLSHLTNDDDDYEQVILQMMAYTLITDSEFKRTIGRFFMCVGSGGNGKGTLLQVIKKILNPKNCSTLSIDQITKEQYSNNMIGKLANLGDDVEDEAIDTVKMKLLKNISTCDDMALRKLFRNSVNVQLTISLIFTSNHILKSFEKGDSYKRRVVWLPMYTKVTKKDPKFISKLTSPEALEYWFSKIVKAYEFLYTNGDFIESDLLKEFNENYHRENDNTIEYCENLEDAEIEGMTIKEVSEQYTLWCEENGYKPLAAKKLKEQIKIKLSMDNTQVKKVSGKSRRVFVKQ